MAADFAVDVINSVVSCLFIVFVGFLLSHFHIFKPEDFQRADRISGKVCFPVLQYRSLAYKKLKEYTFAPLFNAILMNASSQILLLVFFLFPKSIIEDPLEFYLSTTISSVFVNYVPIGAIVIEQVWGPNLDHIIGICPLSNFFILVPFFLLEARLWEILKEKKKLRMEYEKRKAAQREIESQNSELEDSSLSNSPLIDDEIDEKSLRLTWRDVLNAFLTAIRAPIVIGTIIGFLWSLIGIPYPPYIDVIGQYMGDIVLIYGLLGVGHVLAVNGAIACHWVQLIFLLIVRFFICPGLSLFFAWAFKLKGRTARMATIFSALPSSNGAYVVAQTAGVGVKATSSMIFFTLILIVPVLILWFYMFDKFNLFVED